MDYSVAGVKRNSRKLTPDVVRAVAIIMVVWGHLIQVLYSSIVSDIYDIAVFRMIYTVHMPLFMLISGYFFYNSNNNKALKEKVVNRIKGILMPLLIWNTVHYTINIIFDIVLVGEFTFSGKQFLKELFEGYWFLWAIFAFSIVMSLARCIPCLWLRVCCYLGFAVIMIPSPCRWPMLTMYPFFLVGYCYHYMENEKPNLIKTKFWIVLGSGGLYLLSLIVYFRESAMGNSEVKVLLEKTIEVLHERTMGAYMHDLLRFTLFYLMGLAGSVFVISLIHKLFRNGERGRFINAFAKIGMYSLQIYILQRILIEQIWGKIYKNYYVRYFKDYIMTHIWLITVVITLLLAVLFSCFITFVFDKIKNKRITQIIFGR